MTKDGTTACADEIEVTTNPVRTCCNRTSERSRAKRKAYRAAHRAEKRLHDKVYREKHREQRRERDRAYRVANREVLAQRQHLRRSQLTPDQREKINARYNRWVQKKFNGLDYNRMKSEQRRARLAQAPVNDLSLAQWREILVIWKRSCAYCGKKPKRLTQDHITPLSKGGSHTVSNVVPACWSCNSGKGNRPPIRAVQPLLFTVAKNRS